LNAVNSLAEEEKKIANITKQIAKIKEHKISVRH
jgi:hypothetical protein